MTIGVGSSTALTPAGGSLGQLKRSVADYVQGADDEDILDVAARELNYAVDHLNKRTWEWMLKTDDLTLVASTETYQIANDFKKPRKLLRINSDSKRDGYIDYQEPKVFYDEYPASTQDGDSRVYTVRNAASDLLLTLHCPPSSSFVASYPTLQLHYYARVQHFSDDGDTVATVGAPPEVGEFLVWYGRWGIATVRGAPSGIIDRAYAHWNRTLRDMKTDDRDTMTDWEV